jgi:N-carbamoylputrescine amidase
LRVKELGAMNPHVDAVGGTGLVTLACLQMQPSFGDVASNVTKSVQLIERAADQGANLVVLPELCSTGYVFSNREEAFAVAEEVPAGPTASAWIECAARHRLHLVAGICERAGNKLYNSAVVIGPDGYVGTFRKVHLWNEEALYFEPGDLGFPVFHTPIGRIGVAICYDGWFPETFRLCALQGADIVCVPTNWVPIPGQADGRQAMANILAMAAAHSNSMFIACADRVGIERGQPFEGQSLIVSYTGWPVAGPASREQPQRGPAQAELERLQPGPPRPSNRRLQRDARERSQARLVLNDK